MVLAKTIGFIAAILLYILKTYGTSALPSVPLDAHVLHLMVIASLSLLVVNHLTRGMVIVFEARGCLRALC